MAELKSPFRYDFVGSFLRPQRLKEARAQFKAGEIDRAALTAVENEEITRLIEKQKRAGYHAITDGEFAVATGIWILCGGSTVLMKWNWITVISSTVRRLPMVPLK